MTSRYDEGRMARRRELPPRPGDTGGGRHAEVLTDDRGLSGPLVVALLIGVTAVGGLFDVATGTGLRVGYGLGFVLGCAVAAMAVSMRDKVWAVFAPPLVFGVVSVLGAIAASRRLERQVISLDTVSETFLRLIAPDKAPYLLAGFAIGLAIVLIRMALVRK